MPQTKTLELRLKLVETKDDWETFIRLPWIINQDDSNWVPPLISSQKDILDIRKHPFWANNPVAFFLAEENQKPLGRIAAFFSHQHEKVYRNKTGFFGFFEAVDREDVFQLLLNKACDWVWQYGCRKLIGPVNPSINYEMGVLVDGFHQPPFVMLTHNPPYYDARIQGVGFDGAKDFEAYLIKADQYKSSEKAERLKDRVRERTGISIRHPNMKEFEAELFRIQEIYNDAFSNHWGFIPMSEEEFRFLATDLKKIIDPELVLIGEIKGKPIGFLLALPNINEALIKVRNGKLFPTGFLKLLWYGRKIKGVRIITMALKKKYQNLGLGSLFYLEIAEKIQSKGYSKVELSWVMEENHQMKRAIRLFGGQLYKTYRLYEKEL